MCCGFLCLESVVVFQWVCPFHLLSMTHGEGIGKGQPYERGPGKLKSRYQTVHSGAVFNTFHEQYYLSDNGLMILEEHVV